MNLLKYRFQLIDFAILALMMAAMYGRLLGADFQANWDDNVYILNNESIRGFSWVHIRSAFEIGSGTIGQYNPLALLSFMADYTVWGLQPGGYHLTNIVIHALNGLLVYRLLFRLHGDRMLSLVASAIFLLHPVQVESVAWISERKGLLSLLCMLLSWEWYCRYRDGGEGRGRLAYAASLAAFVLSLLAKTSSVVLPLILMLYDCYFFEKDRRVRIVDKVPFFVVAGIFSAIEIYSESPAKGGSMVAYHGGSPLATFFTMLPVFCRYLGLLLWPAGLNAEHAPPVYRSMDAVVIGAAILLAAVLSDMNYPGWHATVNGKPSEIFDAYGMFKSVFLPVHGEYDVIFEFRPMTVFIGAIVSIVSTCILAVLLFILYRKKRLNTIGSVL